MKSVALAIAFAGLAPAAHAQAVQLKPELAGVAFLIGDWSAGRGQVADTGGTSMGASHIAVAASGGALLRQDRTDLFDKAGHPAGGFDQLMMIYPEAGTLHADYSDGEHVIHYTSADITPGKAVVFASADRPDAPRFRLSYTLTDPKTLSVAFSMRPPGGKDFRPIATGTLAKDR